MHVPRIVSFARLLANANSESKLAFYYEDSQEYLLLKSGRRLQLDDRFFTTKRKDF